MFDMRTCVKISTQANKIDWNTTTKIIEQYNSDINERQ